MFIRREISLGDTLLRYWERNPAAPQVVIFIHGFKGDHTGLTQLAQTLNDYRVILVDLPGFGESEPIKEHHSIGNYAAALHNLYLSLNITSCHVVGHSYGGSIALVYAAKYPKAINSLALIAPAISDRAILRLLVSLQLHINKLLPKSLQKVWMYSPPTEALGFLLMVRTLSRRQVVKTLEKEFRHPKKLNSHVLAECLDSFNRTNFLATAKKIQTPTLILAAEKDPIAPLHSMKLLHKLIPTSTLTILPETGHLANLEMPGTLANRLHHYIAKHRQAAPQSPELATKTDSYANTHQRPPIV